VCAVAFDFLGLRKSAEMQVGQLGGRRSHWGIVIGWHESDTKGASLGSHAHEACKRCHSEARIRSDRKVVIVHSATRTPALCTLAELA